MDTKDIKESIASAKKEFENLSMDSVKTTIEKLGRTLHDRVADIFGWSADYHFVEISNIDVLDNYQTYNIVDTKQIKVLIPEESMDKTDDFIIIIPKSELKREPNIMDIVYLRNRLYTVNISFSKDEFTYEVRLQKYEKISVLKF